MKKFLLAFVFLYFTNSEAQSVSTFMETTSNGCYGLDISDNFLYVVSSFSGKVHRKALSSSDITFETFNIGGSGYNNICKIGNFVYVSKPYNGSPGIYRFNPESATIVLESFLSFPNVYSLEYKDSELYFRASNKIYKVNLSSSIPEAIIIADNISVSSSNSIGLKAYGNYLYFPESTGIYKINLISGNYEKEIITTFTGRSFAIGNDNKMYLTSNGLDFSAVYQVDLQTQTSSLLTQITGFIGTYDIVFDNNSLYVTTREGDYNKVAKIDLTTLNTDNIKIVNPHIFPSLVDDFINLVGIYNIESVKIINQNGQVKSVKIENNKINVSELSAGIYFIRTNEWIEKFIKK